MQTQDYAAHDLDELDRGLVHALQIHPRAPWTLVGDVLAVNPVTAARRWRRLQEAGLAWVTAYPQLSDSRVVVTASSRSTPSPGSGGRGRGPGGRTLGGERQAHGGKPGIW
ncbi:hypothetical protein GCM10017744_009850 [Streptomyces antimycoticus]